MAFFSKEFKVLEEKVRKLSQRITLARSGADYMWLFGQSWSAIW